MNQHELQTLVVHHLPFMFGVLIQRSVVEVQWESKQRRNIYRLGHRGKVCTGTHLISWQTSLKFCCVSAGGFALHRACSGRILLS